MRETYSLEPKNFVFHQEQEYILKFKGMLNSQDTEGDETFTQWSPPSGVKCYNDPHSFTFSEPTPYDHSQSVLNFVFPVLI